MSRHTFSQQQEEDIMRAAELMHVAVRMDTVDAKVACFVVARILRQENINLLVCAQSISCRDHMERRPVSNELYLQVGDRLINRFGIYQNVDELADELIHPLGVVRAQAYGQPRPYPVDEAKEADDIHTGWGYTSSDIEAMVDALIIEDRAERIHRATSPAGSASIPRRL